MRRSVESLVGLLVLAAAPSALAAPAAGAPAVAEALINGDSMRSEIGVLASDRFEGRSPGTPGEEATVTHLIEEFRRVGLKPGNPDGTYVQIVPLVGATADYRIEYEREGRRRSWERGREVVAYSRRQTPEVEVKGSELVFAGYGVEAPEYSWDDYKGLDVRGKTLVMLVNDPQVTDPKDPSKLDETMFQGKAMTYYGRWDYKYAIAARKGAAAAIIVHDTPMAGYPFQVLVNSQGRENFTTASEDLNRGKAAVDSWITLDAARALFKDCGKDFDALRKTANLPDFRPIPLGAKLNVSMKLALRRIPSRNVVGRIEGSDEKLRQRYVVYSAHWDHFGRDPKLSGDQIFHGALDNASGVAGLLEEAKAFRALKTPPRSSVLFIATTAEERGLLGANYYVEHPLYPLGRTMADINFDGAAVWGRTRDLVIAGVGLSTLEDQLRRLLADGGRILKPEAHPERGMYYRTDQFEFSKAGVPSIWYSRGNEVIGKPEGWAIARTDDFIEHDYHKVTDVIKPDWDLSGAVEDLRVFFRLGYEIAQGAEWPGWKPKSEFRLKREESAAERRGL